MLTELFGLAQLDGEVADDRKIVQIECSERIDVMRAGQLERGSVGEELQSVGSMR
jgi:hypothetical protein